ncbi:1-phosphatidylinositol 4:5-bisphosphate phosphodiesterase gamma-1-like protein [Dinothrombium tinctorium]|uniref:phosphoinositide phospholipase C n=1 Tax=Dinothrombium tinctorium TaxID=1965070 RepID=A0A443RHN8_9ACAR|nr:1-phosphatidylinositol 4:5-bisphosphate phosphodiesterase gamma-1-like protein [Dinothrombium tinctorium]RWS14783.1 1-phosphatidylinositol 4:5-bisphosphate phosphodiesterase gamma-1-like protein [Dinothrombium tinctorium]
MRLFIPTRFVSTSLASVFNKLSVNAAHTPLFTTDVTGLFGYKELSHDSGFYVMRENAIIEAELLVKRALNPERKQKMVQIFDQLSNCLCKVADMSEFIRFAHPLPRFRMAAEEASMTISAEVEKLNTNKELYDALFKVVNTQDVVPTDDIDNHVAKLFLFDFEQSGIHLSDEKRKLAVRLNESILHLSSYFINNTQAPRNVKQSLLPEGIRHCFHLEGDNVVVNGLYSNAENELVREAAYRIYLYPDDYQNKILTELLIARKFLASMCGFKSYAERAVRGSIADTPEFVKNFLEILTEKLRPLAAEDYQGILEMKKKQSPFAKAVKPWDMPFYTALFRQTQFSKCVASCAPYFSLGSCMDGLNLIFNRLYGVELSVCETKRGEVWNPNIIKLNVSDKYSKTLLGHIYCDFFERESKPNQDCHFTIRGGCQLPNGEYQIPVVVLCLNLPNPNGNYPTLLSPHMVDNLFHEMGHAMHSMLARTPYQHITGTRCSTDLAEVPSILMENFASDPRVIRLMAKHYITGEEIPENLLDIWIESRKSFSASETQLQVFYAMLDQVYHSENPLLNKQNTTEVLEEIQNKYYGLPYVPQTAWQLRFSHLVGYGAKYYSYLVSKAVSHLIWKKLFEEDPLSSAAGDVYKREVLSHGGGKPAKDIVESVLERDVTPESLADSVVEETKMSRIKAQEMEQIIRRLEQGSVLTKFYPKGRPEKRTFCIKRETRQLIWKRPVAGKQIVDSFIDLREVKEVRIGMCSKVFERWQEEAKKWEPSQCFVILYGSSFKLKNVSCAAMSPKECEQWVRGIKYLTVETLNAPYPLQVESWLRKEFYAMEDCNGVITLKDVKQFLPKINFKLPTYKLKEFFQEVDTNKIGEIGFENFAALYHKLIHDNHLFNELFNTYSSDGKTVILQEFSSFLSHEQKDPLSEDERVVSKFMREYLLDPLRDAEEPIFTVPEFMDFLFSKENELWDRRHSQVNQDMNRPLTHYWIASSHNTYLTGDQITSESSTDAYARCLRMGCRSIELDCWDGPDGMPVIYHGYTVTTKIKFIDTLKAIKEHAFVTSEYPVILSIENHCSLPQQRNMATAFQEILGDLLLTQPVSADETEMPSPHLLKRKFIIKHKKLPEGTEMPLISKSQDETEPDISNSVKNGILFLEDPVDKEWKPHFFMLTNDKMYYAEESRNPEDDDESDDRQNSLHPSRDPGSSDELHFGEKWFHGKLAGGRGEAAELLRRYSHLGDGTFLVRESETFVGDYSLSFWRQGNVNHCRIRSRQEKGTTKYWLIETVTFNSLYALINHYQTHPLRSQEFSVILTEPVPQPNSHESKEWYHAHMSRQTAEDYLQRLRYDGAFLVRPSEQEENCFAISFRAEDKIKHCRIKQEGRLFVIGNAEFESLVELINWYEKFPLYKNIKLKYPVNAEVVRRIGADPNTQIFTPEGNYMDPASFQSRITVKALYDYQANREDELSFCKHAIITNVLKQDSGWWKGDYGGKKQHWFPSNFVEEIESNDKCDDNSGEAMPLGKLQKGSINIVGCTVISSPNRGREWVFRIVSPSHITPIDISAPSEDEMQDWICKIRETAQSVNDQVVNKIRKSKEIERSFKIAKEFSDIIVYCRAVSFDINIGSSKKHNLVF